MTASEEVLFIMLFGVIYDVSPVMLIWGWIRWLRRPMSKESGATLSLIGLMLATASALAAVSLILYDQLIAGGADYDPRTLSLFRIGALLSLAAVVIGVGGVWRTNCLRWLTPLCALGTLAFWICAAVGE